jgi:hypothetical protein
MRWILHKFFILQHLLVQNTTVLDSFNSSIIKTYWMYLIILLKYLTLHVDNSKQQKLSYMLHDKKKKLEKKYAPTIDNYGQSCFDRSDFLKDVIIDIGTVV